MPKAPRHARMAARLPRQRITHDYEITDRTHKPDLRGEFAGVKVKRIGSRQVVRLSERQAKFYLDQGVLRRLPGVVGIDAPASVSAPAPARASARTMRPAAVRPFRRR